MPYIYKITNIKNQKSYIGKTSLANPQERWKEHQNEARRGKSNHRAIYRALNKYGIENFTFEILEETNLPNEREQFYILFFDTYHNGYNETLGGDGTAYLNLSEQEVCKYYLKCKAMEETARHFHCSRGTVSNILYKYNIPRFSLSETNSAMSTSKKTVAKLDKNTQEILEVYESIAEAERKNQCNGHIVHVCQGKRKTAGGFSWRYL